MNDAAALAVSRETLVFLLPEIVMIAVATAMMTAGAFVRLSRRAWASIATLTLVAALAILGLAVSALPAGVPDPYAAVVAHDALSTYGRLGLLLAGLIILALAHDQVDDARAAEFFAALVFVHAGALVVVSANELVLLFVGLELVSIPTYVLLYLPRRSDATQEAATKYFYLSIFSSGLLLFGLAYLYGLTGASNLKALAYLAHWPDGGSQLGFPQPLFATIALVFVMAGLGFRVAAVPFHFYAPDVYQGSPTVLAALLAWVPKAVGFVAILRVLAAIFGWEPGLLFAPTEATNLMRISDKGVWLAALLAVATMTLGNTVALAQDDLKRLLAYSSIAHAGYLLVGLAAAFRNAAGGSEAVLGADAIVFYLATYALMTLGAFGVMLLLSAPGRPVEKIDDLSGLIWTRRWPAAMAMALCLFSLAGIPPLAGFWGKLRIFWSALEAARGDDARTFQLLTVAGVINAAIGAYYYLRIIMIMIFRAPLERYEVRGAWPTALSVGACAALSLWFGVFPDRLTAVARAAGQAVVALPVPGAIDLESPEAPAFAAHVGALVPPDLPPRGTFVKAPRTK